MLHEEEFDFNGLSRLLRPCNGSTGLCVIVEINWCSGRTQGCIDTSPMRYNCEPKGQGWVGGGGWAPTVLYSTAQSLPCIGNVFFTSLYRSSTSTFFHFHIFPFRAFSWHIFLTLSLKSLTFAEPSWKQWYLVGSPLHQIFMSILDGN